MKTEKIEVIESEYDLQSGFAYCICRDHSDDSEFTLQACLSERKECANDERRRKMVDEGLPLFRRVIEKSDDGMDWGICGDVNFAAYDKYTESACRKIFSRALRSAGIKFV